MSLLHEKTIFVQNQCLLIFTLTVQNFSIVCLFNIFFNEWTEEKEVQLSICFDWQNTLQKKILFCKQKFLFVNFVQLSFRYRFLVQFKVTLKSVLLKQKLFLYLFGMNSLKKCGYKGKALLYIRQKQLNFRYRSLGQFKVT